MHIIALLTFSYFLGALPFGLWIAWKVKGLDIRTVGLSAGIDLAARADGAGERGYEAMDRAFHDEDLVIRIAGYTLAIAPPLVVSEAQIGEIFDKVGRVIKAVM